MLSALPAVVHVLRTVPVYRIVHDSADPDPHEQQDMSKPSRSSQRSRSTMSNDSAAWLILEFCDKGCLQV